MHTESKSKRSPSTAKPKQDFRHEKGKVKKDKEPKKGQSHLVIKDESNSKFTVLLSVKSKCSKCDKSATNILLGKENEFINFFCQEHGQERHIVLESRYHFEQEEKAKPFECLNCKKLFIRRQEDHKFCKNKCKTQYWRKSNPEKWEKHKKVYLNKKENNQFFRKLFCLICKRTFHTFLKNHDESGPTICQPCIADKEDKAFQKAMDSFDVNTLKPNDHLMVEEYLKEIKRYELLTEEENPLDNPV